MIELSEKLIIERKALSAEGYEFDERWDEFALGIKSFFVLIGLSGNLPPKHQYYFFPSLNRSE